MLEQYAPHPDDQKYKAIFMDLAERYLPKLPYFGDVEFDEDGNYEINIYDPDPLYDKFQLYLEEMHPIIKNSTQPVLLALHNLLQRRVFRTVKKQACFLITYAISRN
ncbi:MAG TPA: hypothetical protein VGT05_04055 [Patescibacteria group bacterium]|nr:hypothetical protein [Patescibacteria group bacterium]